MVWENLSEKKIGRFVAIEGDFVTNQEYKFQKQKKATISKNRRFNLLPYMIEITVISMHELWPPDLTELCNAMVFFSPQK